MSHISKLHLFAKNTDAPHVIRGFKYQELKTLESWLSNKVNGIDEDIFCDFEEDIFQRDLKGFRATFKQIKLYSSKNFSFASDEIQKAMFHFFMLFVKGDYLFDDPTFIFETNTGVARTYGDNDAKLLEDWANNHNDLSQELTNQCILKVKSIVDPIIEERYQELEASGKTSELLIAKGVYESLSNEVWEKFVRSIRWHFEGKGADESIKNTLDSIFELIDRLPFPLEKEDHSLVFERLRGTVSDKSIGIEPHERQLTNDLLDQQLLSLGSKDDKSYLETYEIWKEVDHITQFKIGEFYQVLIAAKHCRKNSYLLDHGALWLKHLNQYYGHTNTPRKYKREVIYELIWSTLRPKALQRPENSLKGLEDMVIEYFSDIHDFKDLESLEDALNLMTVIIACNGFDLINLEDDLIIQWVSEFSYLLNECKEQSSDNNILCGLLEIEGFFFINMDMLNSVSDGQTKGSKSLNEIISLLPDANQYAVSHLGKRLDSILELAIQHGSDDLEELEKFSEELLPYVEKREGDFSLARSYTHKGWRYLKTTNPQGLLKALDFFHRAKDLYYNEAAYEGYVLALMAISQLYAAIRMNLAAKYYATSAIWVCGHQGTSNLLKRISDSYFLLCHYDFKQGSWLNYLQNLETYFGYRSELDPTELDPNQDQSFGKILAEMTFVLTLTPKIASQLSSFIEHYKSEMGVLFELIEDGVPYLEEIVKKEGLKTILERKLDSSPINDIGPERTITWKVNSQVWVIRFENKYIENSVSEEFAALLQIIQTELLLKRIDLNLASRKIEVHIKLVKTPKPPVVHQTEQGEIWKVNLSVLDSKKSTEKNKHYAMITASIQSILTELSALSHNKVKGLFLRLLQSGLDKRALVANAYQRAYRDLISEQKFNELRRDKFNSEIIEIEHKDSPVSKRGD